MGPGRSTAPRRPEDRGGVKGRDRASGGVGRDRVGRAGQLLLRPAVLRLLVVAASLPSLSSCYLLNQGVSLLRYQAAAEPIDDILERGTYSDGKPVRDQTRAFLVEVEKISAFAAGLGLSASGNYESLVPTQRDHLADVVNATAELSFERHEWWWPLVGKLPYKGYYDPAGARRLAARLSRRGLDVWVRPVDAFSTLGILKDPLYEFMTTYDRYTIANLIIHERAHATLFLRGHAQFNEEFATFVGDAGAEAYLRSVGASEEEIAVIGDRTADRETARLLMLGLRRELNEIYNSALDTDEKRGAKAKTIADFRERLATDYESIFTTDLFRGLADVPINNAYIDLYVSYTEDLELFRDLLRQYGDLRAVIRALQVLADPRQIADREARSLARRDPKAYVRTFLLDSAGAPSVE